MQRDGIVHGPTYIKAVLDAERVGSLQSGRGEVPAVDDSFAIAAIEEQEQTEETKAAASATVQPPTVEQPLTAEVGEHIDATQTPAATDSLGFEQFKKWLVPDMFREDELPAIYQAYRTNKLPFIAPTEASIARAAELVENGKLKACYPELHGAISSWYISVADVEPPQSIEPTGPAAGTEPLEPSEDFIDTDMPDVPVFDPAAHAAAAATGKMVYVLTGVAKTYPDDPQPTTQQPFASVQAVAQPSTPVLTAPAPPVQQGRVHHAQSSTSEHHDNLAKWEQEILNSNFAMTWNEHFEIVKRMMLVVSRHENDARVKSWLDSPDPLHNTGGNRRRWWKTRVMLGVNGKLGQTVIRDRSDYEAEQRRGYGPISDSTARWGAQGVQAAGNTQSKTTANAQLQSHPTLPFGGQQGGGRSALGSSQPPLPPAIGLNVSPTVPPNQRQITQSISHQPTGSQSTAANWSAVGTLEQRLQTQHSEGAEWELIVETMKAILLKLKNIAASGSSGHIEVTEWMKGDSVFVGARPRRGWFMVAFTRVRAYPWASKELRDSMADLGVPYTTKQILANEFALWNSLDEIPENNNAVQKWLAAQDPVIGEVHRHYWQELWNAPRTRDGRRSVMEKKRKEYVHEMNMTPA